MGLRVKLLNVVGNGVWNSISPHSFTQNMPVHCVEGRLKVNEHELRDDFFILSGFPVINKLISLIDQFKHLGFRAQPWFEPVMCLIKLFNHP